MRALIVLTTDSLGGAEKTLKMITEELLRRKVEVDVLFYKRRRAGGWDDLANRVNLYFTSFKKERYAYLTLPYRVWKYSREKYEYTFSSNVSVNGWMGILRKIGLLRSRYVIGREATLTLDRSSGWRRIYFKGFYNFGYSALDLIIFQTNHMKKRLEMSEVSMKKWKHKIVLANAVNVDAIRKKAKEPITSLTRKPFMIAVGRLKNVKGYDILINAFAKVNTNFNLVILGEGKARKELEELIFKLKLEDRVYLPGHSSNPYPYMLQAHCCIISSRIEGFPNTLLEMMTLNDRVVSTTCAGDIEELKGVVTCNTENIKDLAKAIIRATQLSDKERKQNKLNFDEELQKRSIESYLDVILDNLRS